MSAVERKESDVELEESEDAEEYEDLDALEPASMDELLTTIRTDEDDELEGEAGESNALLLYNGHRVSQKQLDLRAKFDSKLKVNCHFYEFLAKGTHSDITFVVGPTKERILAHRLMLAARSPVFGAMLFSKHFLESSVAEVEIPDVEPVAFRIMLRAIYTDVVELRADQAMNVLLCAKKYQVEALRLACVSYMKKELTAENALTLFDNLPGMLEEELFVLQFVQEHFAEISESKDFEQLRKARVLDLIQSESLFSPEAKVFAACHRWGLAECKRQSLEASRTNLREVLKDIVPHIRFPLMSLEELSSIVAPSGALPDELMVQLFTHIASEGSVPTQFPFSSAERSQGELPFPFRKQQNGDAYLCPGVLEFIGTSRRTKPWQNPHQASFVVVTYSSHSPALNPNNLPHHVVERIPSTSFGTDNQADSWIRIDLKKCSVRPNMYRFSNTRKSNCMPTHWRFEGSTDLSKWDLLDERQNASGLLENYVMDDSKDPAANVISGVFRVKKPTTSFYRYFRFVQPGSSSNGGFGHLCCAGVEFFGLGRFSNKS